MDFKAITQLKLKYAFSDMPAFQQLNVDGDYLNELFECDSRGTLFVHDDAATGHSIFVPDTSGIGIDKVFVVKNINRIDVYLWHIDGVLFQKDSKCDCAVLTDKNLAFVEFKANAGNKSDQTIKGNYEKASGQLLLTLDEVSTKCKSVGVDLRRLVQVGAYAVFNRTVPKNSAYQKKVAAKFLLDSRGTKLHFKNNILL